MPIRSASEKPLMILPPKMNSDSTTNSVVPEVMTVRVRVWLIEVFMTSIGVPLRMVRKFSRMRSNTTMVSFSE